MKNKTRSGKTNADFYAIIPGYNEAKSIDKVIPNVEKFAKNIIFVDDGSLDNTYEKVLKHKITVLRHIVNLGKGAAVKTGCDYALSIGAKKIVVLDADTQHDPKHIPEFIRNLENNDIVFGYRVGRKHMPAILRFGNWFINAMTYFLFGMSLRDTQSGYRSFTSKAYKKIRWNANDYSMESEMIANAGRKKLKYKEIPIATIYSNKYKGTTVVDGIKIVLRLIKWRFTKCF